MACHDMTQGDVATHSDRQLLKCTRAIIGFYFSETTQIIRYRLSTVCAGVKVTWKCLRFISTDRKLTKTNIFRFMEGVACA